MPGALGRQLGVERPIQKVRLSCRFLFVDCSGSCGGMSSKIIHFRGSASLSGVVYLSFVSICVMYAHSYREDG